MTGREKRTVCYVCRDFKECEYLAPSPAIDQQQKPEWVCEVCRLGWLTL